MYFFYHNRFLLLIYVALFSGCSLTPLAHPTLNEVQQKTEKLSMMLQRLDTTVELKEAKDLAKEAILYSSRLAKRYELVSPPLWHNTLINVGIKERGLCYQWAEDLLAHLHRRGYQSVVFHYVGSDIGSYFEHNAIAVSAKGMGFKDGILLDAWRDSGNLFFVRVNEDKKYEWRSREDIYKMMFPHLKRWEKF